MDSLKELIEFLIANYYYERRSTLRHRCSSEFVMREMRELRKEFESIYVRAERLLEENLERPFGFTAGDEPCGK